MTMLSRASLGTVCFAIGIFSACSGQADEGRSIRLATEQPDTFAQMLAARQAAAIEAVSRRSASTSADYLHPDLWLVDLRSGSADSVSYYAIVNGTHELSIDPVDRNSVPELLGADPPTLKSRLSGGDQLLAVWRRNDGEWKAVTMVLTR